jgi:hypothetical protein
VSAGFAPRPPIRVSARQYLCPEALAAPNSHGISAIPSNTCILVKRIDTRR